MSQEQRNAFRINMPDGQKRATLRTQGRTMDVQLLDASATGVALACPLNCTLEIDNHCELHTSSGGGQIRIVRKEVFSDGILLGAVRTGDLREQHRGLLASATEHVTHPIQALARCSLPTRIAIIAGGCALATIVASIVYWQLAGDQQSPDAQAQVPVTPVVEQSLTPEEVRDALSAVEALLPKPTELTESDLRAQRIFDQQKQLLDPEISRRLRLTPTQESRIQRALKPAEELATDATNPLFWEAIRRCETQILTILTPTQVKAWRQQSGT